MDDTYKDLIAQNHPVLATTVSTLSDPEIKLLLYRLVDNLDERLCMHPEIAAYQSRIRSGRPFTYEGADRLRATSETLDEEYFAMQEAGAARDLWRSKFNQARIAYAMWLMAQGPTRANIGGILYELAHAHDPPESLYDRVAEELQRSH